LLIFKLAIELTKKNRLRHFVTIVKTHILVLFVQLHNCYCCCSIKKQDFMYIFFAVGTFPKVSKGFFIKFDIDALKSKIQVISFIK